MNKFSYPLFKSIYNIYVLLPLPVGVYISNESDFYKLYLISSYTVDIGNDEST